MYDKLTVPAIRACKHRRKLAMITAYDAPSALIADRAAMDIILVGDSLATTVLGFEDTLPATIDVMLHHTSAVTRMKPKSLVVADMILTRFCGGHQEKEDSPQVREAQRCSCFSWSSSEPAQSFPQTSSRLGSISWFSDAHKTG